MDKRGLSGGTGLARWSRVYHFVAHGHRWTPLYRDAAEACALWELLAAHLAGLTAACVMPDHVHVLHPRGESARFAAFRRGYARSRNRLRGSPGAPVWDPAGAGEWVPRGKRREKIRYVHLNPCRGRLVADPLDWPLSTHRDAVGLTLGPVRRVEADPDGFHGYVSADRKVQADGTPLPIPGYRPLAVERVGDVVAGLLRVPRARLETRGPARRLWISAARELTGLGAEELAAGIGVSRASVYRATVGDPSVRRVCAVAHDRRFGSIERLVVASARRGR